MASIKSYISSLWSIALVQSYHKLNVTVFNIEKADMSYNVNIVTYDCFL